MLGKYRLVQSHPSRKSKNAARVGHPEICLLIASLLAVVGAAEVFLVLN
jgi:hypothetical protein